MNLSEEQTQKIIHVWSFYVENVERFLNKSGEFTDKELDQRRLLSIPEIQKLITDFIDGQLELGIFKTKLDGINKKNRLWGFMAINGQMFFNVLTKNSQKGGRTEELLVLLRDAILMPTSQTETRFKIEKFVQFVRELSQLSENLQGAAKVGSIPYFLSYFWQIQNQEKFPIYYTSMVTAFQKLDIWSPSKNAVEDYLEFYDLNFEMVEILRRHTGNKQLSLWDVEHAFWLQNQILDRSEPAGEYCRN